MGNANDYKIEDILVAGFARGIFIYTPGRHCGRLVF
jgi:hypothetical protein